MIWLWLPVPARLTALDLWLLVVVGLMVSAGLYRDHTATADPVSTCWLNCPTFTLEKVTP